MSKTTKKKIVVSGIFESTGRVPEVGEKIVRVLYSRGSNLYEVEDVNNSEDSFLVSMPTKFRKTVWVKRGSYLIVQPIEEGNKVKGEISEILNDERIKFLKKEGFWQEKEKDEESYEDEIPVNTNRHCVSPVQSDSDSSDEN